MGVNRWSFNEWIDVLLINRWSIKEWMDVLWMNRWSINEWMDCLNADICCEWQMINQTSANSGTYLTKYSLAEIL